MQRVRVGAIGLACVFLLVMLATALLHAAGDRAVTIARATTNAAQPSEPLAELGVVPGNPVAGTAAAPPPHPAPPRR